MSLAILHKAQHNFLKNTVLNSKLKLAFFASGLSALLLTSAQAARVYDKDGTNFDIFGSVKATFGNDHALSQISHDPSQDDTTIYPLAKLGIAGRSEISHGLDAVMMAQWESYKDSSNDSSDNNILGYTKYMFAGLDAYQYGTLIVGRGDTAYYTVAGATDIFDDFSTYANDYYMLGEQRPGLVMYSLRGLSWDLKLSYQFAKDNFGHTPLHVNYGWSASVSTKFGENVTFAYGFDYHQFQYGNDADRAREFFTPMMATELNSTAQQANDHLRVAEIDSMLVYGVALSYGTFGEGLYGAVVLGATDYTNMHHYLYNVDTALNYTFPSGLGLSIGYGYKGYDDLTIISDLTVGASFKFNGSFKLYSQAQFDLGGEASSFYTPDYCQYYRLNEDKFVIGAEYKF